MVASLEDLKKGGVKNIPLKSAPPLKCSEHDKTLKLFCFHCDRIICRDCTIIDHKEHKFEFLKKCAPESRKTLRDSLAPLQKVQDDIACAKKTLVTEHDKVATQEKEVYKSIEQSFDALKAVLEQRKTELVKKANKLAQEKKKSLTAQKEVFQAAQKEIQILMEFVERNIESTSDQDLMSIHTQLQTKMEEEEQRHRQLSLKTTATADIMFNTPSTDVIPKNLGSVFDPSTPHLLYKRINVVIAGEVGSPVQVTLAAPTASLNDISADLKCVVNPEPSVKCRVIENGVGMYSIRFNPQVRGRHDLIVKVKNEEITGSPFRVFVKVPLSQLGQNIRGIGGGFSSPWGIAINNKQQLVVAEAGGKKITIMERDGKKVQTIECAEFRGPCGVATAVDGAIYVTDVDAQCLFKFNPKGKLLKTVCNELQRPYSVKIIQNQLYVVDKASQLVKIFDMDCNVVGTIKIRECPNPWDIAEGPDGLYVAGSNISVYSHDGVFIRHLNLQPSSLKISFFRGICFDSSGHIIASDRDYDVYIFKPSGECVGHVVSSKVICYPAGVTVDEDGFVYVCGCLSHNVITI